MIYDVGAALDFTKEKKVNKSARDDEVYDRTSYDKRKEMLRKL